MSKGLRRLFAVLASSLMLVLSSTLTAVPANAATCYGDYCSNKDPQATGCSTNAWTQNAVDAQVSVWSGTTYAGRLELRASNTCGTQWGRFYPQGDFKYDIRLEQPATGYATDWKRVDPWVSVWTNQIYSPRHCVRVHLITYGLWGGAIHNYTSCI